MKKKKFLLLGLIILIVLLTFRVLKHLVRIGNIQNTEQTR